MTQDAAFRPVQSVMLYQQCVLDQMFGCPSSYVAECKVTGLYTNCNNTPDTRYQLTSTNSTTYTWTRWQQSLCFCSFPVCRSTSLPQWHL